MSATLYHSTTKESTEAIVRDGMGRGDLTTHGFRSTFCTWAAETQHFSREVVEMALAHTVGDAAEQAYQRGDMFEKRRRLMAGWAEFCAKPPAKVLEFSKKRGAVPRQA
jgi:integrase